MGVKGVLHDEFSMLFANLSLGEASCQSIVVDFFLVSVLDVACHEGHIRWVGDFHIELRSTDHDFF